MSLTHWLSNSRRYKTKGLNRLLSRLLTSRQHASQLFAYCWRVVQTPLKMLFLWRLLTFCKCSATDAILAVLFAIPLHIHDPGCAFLSVLLLGFLGHECGLPIRMTCLLAAKELHYPTFGKRAAPMQNASSSCSRPADWTSADVAAHDAGLVVSECLMAFTSC